MKYHRFRCFGPWGHHRYAYGMAFSQSQDSSEEQAYSDEQNRSSDRNTRSPGSETWYAHREHRHRGRRSASFGVRRPLRYLSYQLDLDESQRRSIAVVLDSVKVEREQAALDEKKMVGNLADLVAEPEVSTDALKDTLSARVRSTDRLQSHIAKALKEIVGVLDPDQREEFAYLLRSGAFQI